MNELARLLLREMIRNLPGIARNGEADGAPEGVRRALDELAGISPFETERLIGAGKRYLHLDIEGLSRELRRIRIEDMARQMLLAGSENRLLRALFGLSASDISRLRKQTATRPPRRRNLTREEEERVIGAGLALPAPERTELAKVIWCMEAGHKLGIPLMPLYRHVCNPGRNPVPAGRITNRDASQ